MQRGKRFDARERCTSAFFSVEVLRGGIEFVHRVRGGSGGESFLLNGVDCFIAFTPPCSVT